MARSYVVVDGSNIATEGRSTPSLAQLDDAVRQFQQEYPEAEVIVVVDASFGRRIDPSERPAFEEAVAHGELVSPPAGAVGRGDAFLLRIAERVGGQVLSNDSFQEFHAEHPWLFDEGRLVGGKPVPGVGWFFTPRSPVRGARSRAARSAAKAADAGKAVKATKRAAPPTTARADPAAKTNKPATTQTAAKTASASKAGKKAQKEPEKAEKEKKTEKTEKKSQKKTEKKTTKQTEKTAKARKTTNAVRTQKAAKPAKATTPARATKSAKAVKAERSAEAVKAEKGAKKARVAKSAADAAAGERAPSGSGQTRRHRRRRGGGATTEPAVRAAIDAATDEAVSPGVEETKEPVATARRRRGASPPAAVNDPLTFLTFVSEHPLGSRVEGEVSSFVSHGAMVDVDGMHCYVPLAGLAEPPPRRAREVLERGEHRSFVVVALDPPRRGAELALPELADTRLQR